MKIIFTKLLAVFLLSIILIGCIGTKPSFVGMQSKMPVLSEGVGRVYFIGKDVNRGGKIKVDNEYLGTFAWSNTYLYIDLSEGNHNLLATSTGLITIEYKHKLNIHAGETIFFQFERTWGNIRLTKLEPEYALNIISSSRYVGEL